MLIFRDRYITYWSKSRIFFFNFFLLSHRVFLFTFVFYYLDGDSFFLLLVSLICSRSSSSGWPDRIFYFPPKNGFFLFCKTSRLDPSLFDNIEQSIWVDIHRFPKNTDLTDHTKVLNSNKNTSISTKSMMLNLWIDRILQISISSGRIILASFCSMQYLWISWARSFIVVLLLTVNSYLGDNTQFSWSQRRT